MILIPRSRMLRKAVMVIERGVLGHERVVELDEEVGRFPLFVTTGLNSEDTPKDWVVVSKERIDAETTPNFSHHNTDPRAVQDKF